MCYINFFVWDMFNIIGVFIILYSIIRLYYKEIVYNEKCGVYEFVWFGI